MDETVGMLTVAESPHKKAKMEGRHKADFSESKFVKFYKAGACQTVSNGEDNAVNCDKSSCQSPPREAQSTTTLNTSLDNSEYSSNHCQRTSPSNYPVDVQYGARHGQSLNGENKENLQTEAGGK